jgi:2-methylaconitate cis-trans-isomerase PrpF
MQHRIPAVLMRGGTSRAIFFHAEDLPADPAVRDRVIAAAMGSPDPYGRQVDGLGGATSTTSKIAIIETSDRPAIDVNYTFGQVRVQSGEIEYKGNCGNISSAVGPFAIDEGLVDPDSPTTVVRIWNTNTNKLIEATVATRDGQAAVEGDYAIHGVHGSGARIDLAFVDPGGAVTGKLLPTGQVRQELAVPEYGQVTVSIVDATNPIVFVAAEQLGLSGVELPEALSADPALLAKLDAIRRTAALAAGIPPSRAIPKIAFVAPPQAYTTTGGERIAATGVSFLARTLSMGLPHPAYAVTGAVGTAVAARIEGTLVHAVADLDTNDRLVPVRIGHPAGSMEINVEVQPVGNQWEVRRAVVGRTARRLMEGSVLVPERVYRAG